MTRGNLSGNGRKPASHIRAVRRIKIRQSRSDCRKNPRHVRGFLHKPTKNCARRARFVVGKLDRKRGFDRNHPCFCLCFGFWQITITLPLRRMILHFSQIGFTDGLTFMTFYLHQNFWWDGTPENRRPLALGSHTRLRPLSAPLSAPKGAHWRSEAKLHTIRGSAVDRIPRSSRPGRRPGVSKESFYWNFLSYIGGIGYPLYRFYLLRQVIRPRVRS